jgi:hypothetical protein
MMERELTPLLKRSLVIKTGGEKWVKGDLLKTVFLIFKMNGFYANIEFARNNSLKEFKNENSLISRNI